MIHTVELGVPGRRLSGPRRAHPRSPGGEMAKRTCSTVGCGRPHYGRGWCKGHYKRWRVGLDPNKPLNGPLTRAERFWTKVNRDGPVPDYAPHLGPCWIWAAALYQKGYGHFGAYGQAHRVAYEWLVGPIPEGLQLDHLCRVHACVNPAHLEPVTAKENSRRGLAAQSHGVGMKNAKAKLTDDDVREIRRLHDGGTSLHVLSARFGVSYSQVSRVAYRRLWRHVV